MTNIPRLFKSRDNWKRLAVERRKEAESKGRQAAKWKSKCRAAEAERDAAKEKAERLEVQIEKTIPTVVQINIQVFCIFMFFLGSISCRAIPRILNFIQQMKAFYFKKIPHWSSVSNWVCLAGLALLKNVQCWDTRPWIAIIDTSISYSIKKVLVVLRLPLDHFNVKLGAPSLADVECIGLELGDIWNHETVKEALERVFKMSGNPTVIVKDGGYDLRKGVHFWSKENGGCVEISDIGHVVANELKRIYAKNKIFQEFLKLINQARSRLFLTEFSFLRPPKIRTKGRFQNISKIVKWSEKILSLLRVRGQVKKNSVVYKLREVIPTLLKYKFFISNFSRDCKISNEFMEELKNNGLNQKTYSTAKKILKQFPKESLLKNNLQLWLDKHIRIQCKLKIGQTPLLVSSDSIESLMGKIKRIIERNPLQEFGRMVLATPLFCGQHTYESIENMMSQITNKDLQRWQEAHTKDSMRKKKQKIFSPISQKPQVPDPPIAKAA